MEKLVGSFYFKLTKSGNLIGEYYNNKMEKGTNPKTECANLKSGNKRWVGSFNTIWQEESTIYDLEIIENNSPNSGFKLYWKQKNEVIYSGIGFEVDDILIGAYWLEK